MISIDAKFVQCQAQIRNTAKYTLTNFYIFFIFVKRKETQFAWWKKKSGNTSKKKYILFVIFFYLLVSFQVAFRSFGLIIIILHCLVPILFQKNKFTLLDNKLKKILTFSDERNEFFLWVYEKTNFIFLYVCFIYMI